MVSIHSPLVALVEGFESVYLCHLDPYTVTVCTRYFVSPHVVTVHLPTRCLVERFLPRPFCVSDVDTVPGR